MVSPRLTTYCQSARSPRRIRSSARARRALRRLRHCGQACHGRPSVAVRKFSINASSGSWLRLSTMLQYRCALPSFHRRANRKYMAREAGSGARNPTRSIDAIMWQAAPWCGCRIRSWRARSNARREPTCRQGDASCRECSRPKQSREPPADGEEDWCSQKWH
jgi:hypothetical protein